MCTYGVTERSRTGNCENVQRERCGSTTARKKIAYCLYGCIHKYLPSTRTLSILLYRGQNLPIETSLVAALNNNTNEFYPQLLAEHRSTNRRPTRSVWPFGIFLLARQAFWWLETSTKRQRQLCCG